jgi:hypothetical protein
MSDKETFEELLKSKLSERAFAFDEENWEEAEEMITSFRKKEKIKKGAFVFLAGLFLGIIIMLPFVPIIKPNHLLSVKSDNLHSKEVVAEEQIMQPIDEPSSVSTKVKKSETEKQKDETSVLVEKSGLADKQEKVIVEVDTKKTSLNENNTSIVKVNKKGEVRRKEMNPLSNGVLKQSNNLAKAKYSSSLIAKSTIKSTTPLASETIIEKMLEPLNADEEEVATDALLNADLKNNKDSTMQLDSSKTKVISLKDSVLKDSVAIVKKDSAAQSFAEKPKDNLPFDKTCKIAVSVGANYLIAGSLNPIQGIELMKPITLNWSVGTGLYYTYINIKHNNAVKTIVTNTTYDFGYASDVVQIKTNDLHYIVVPVFVQRSINEKNSVVMGVNNYMLFTVSNNYSTYKESYGSKLNVHSNNTFGYSNGFNPYDIGLLLGYRRLLFNNISIGVYMNYGLMNINKKNYYNENIVDKNVSGQMLLTYRLH